MSLFKNIKPGHSLRRSGFASGGGTPLHRYRKGKEPKKPEKTAEQSALERRTQSLLDKSIEEQEEMFKALGRGTLGRQSLLSGSPKTAQEAARGVRSGGGGGAGNLGGGTASPARATGGGVGRSTTNRTSLL